MRLKGSLVLTLFIAVLVRVMPTLYTGNVFSNDSWLLIHVAEHVLENPTAKLFGLTKEFGYHILYPSAIVESIIYTCVAGVDVITFYRLLGRLLHT